jgi:hypothetical protein
MSFDEVDSITRLKVARRVTMELQGCQMHSFSHFHVRDGIMLDGTRSPTMSQVV